MKRTPINALFSHFIGLVDHQNKSDEELLALARSIGDLFIARRLVLSMHGFQIISIVESDVETLKDSISRRMFDALNDSRSSVDSSSPA